MHEHIWINISAHKTSAGVVTYASCSCGAYEVTVKGGTEEMRGVAGRAPRWLALPEFV
jgi:hypothetical protein